jgi:hypothetical protein
MFWHINWDLVCSKMIFHGLNHGLFSLLLKEPIFYQSKLDLVQMAFLSSSFSVFVVLGIYNFGGAMDTKKRRNMGKKHRG